MVLSFALSVLVGLLAVIFAEPLRLAGGHGRTADDLAVLQLGATDY